MKENTKEILPEASLRDILAAISTHVATLIASFLAARAPLLGAISPFGIAFAAGAPIALNKGNLILTILYIGVITFVLSALGVLVGSLFGSHYHKKATFFGGTVLVLLAFKFLFICK